MDELTVFLATRGLHDQWNVIKDTVTDFGFRDYMKRVHGMTYSGHNRDTFKYTVVDEQKFTWFILTHGNRYK